MTTITGNTKLLGVIGCPITHSLSPTMHNAALVDRARRLKHPYLEYIYVPLPIAPADLGTALAGMAVSGWRGFNVTIPHKQAILPYLKTISPLAQAVGAVNTVSYSPETEGWVGTNTDVQGFMAPLKVLDYPWQTLKACILGSGGAARAVVSACTALGLAEIHVVGRDPLKLQSLQHNLAEVNLAVTVQPWTALKTLLPQMTLVVNTTPIGMYPDVNASPLDTDTLAQLPKAAVVYDLIYTPKPTRLLALAQVQGCIAIDGLEMLVQQGAAAFELWTGDAPSLEIMRNAALDHLRDKSG
jgi:shikimate dehydrogenase